MARKQLTFSEFPSGVDTRPGYMSRKGELVWRKRDNVFVDRDGYPTQRPPCKKLDVVLDSDSQGLILYQDRLHTFAGASNYPVSHTGTDAAQITTLYFDDPPGLDTSWELLQSGVFNGKVWASIRHFGPSGEELVAFHVFGKPLIEASQRAIAPTYCPDPWAPSNIEKAYVGAPTVGGVRGETTITNGFYPVFGQSSARALGSLPSGAVAGSITLDPTTWNTLSAEEADISGHIVYWLLPDVAAPTTYLCFHDFLFDKGSATKRVIVSTGSAAGAYIYEGGWAWMEYAVVGGDMTWQRMPGAGDYGTSEIYSVILPAGSDPNPLTTDMTWRVGTGLPVFALDPTRAENTNAIQIHRTGALAGTILVRLRFSWGLSPCLTSITASDLTPGMTLTYPNTEYSHPFLGDGVETGSVYVNPLYTGDYVIGAGPGMQQYGIIQVPSFITGVYHHEWFAQFEPIAYAHFDLATGWSGVVDLTQAATANAEGYLAWAIYSASRSGEADAVILGSAAHEDVGATVRSIGSVRDRLIVQYENSSQLWDLPINSTQAALLDRATWGAGNRTISPSTWTPIGLLVSSEQVPRMVDLDKDLGRYFTVRPAGDPLLGLTIGDMPWMGYWPYNDMVVYAGTVDGTLQFLTMRVDSERRLVSWAQWTVDDVVALDDRAWVPVVDGSEIYFRAQTTGDSSDTSILYFDGDAADFLDFGQSTPAEAVAEFEPYDMGIPGALKRFLQLRVVQEGECKIEYLKAPYGAPTVAHPMPATSGVARQIGMTYGNRMIPMSETAAGLGLRFTVSSNSRWRLFRFGFDFLPVRGA